MPRFYISDGARPGRRTPRIEYATKAGVGSDILNEAQAIARGRKLVPTEAPGIPPPPAFRYWRVRPTVLLNGTGSPIAWLLGELRMFNVSDVNVAMTATRMMSGAPAWGSLTSLNDGVLTGGVASPEHANRDCTAEWFGYDFGAPISIYRVEANNYTGSSAYSVSAFDIEGSNNGTTWELVRSGTGLPVAAGSVGIVYTTAQVEPPAYTGSLLTPINLSGPSALVIKGAEWNPAWAVFDGNVNTTWFSSGNASMTWVGYDFGASPKSVTRWKIYGSGSHWPASWVLESSNDLSNWTVVDTATNLTLTWNTRTLSTPPAAARYWRVRWTASLDSDPGNCEVGALELYGN